MFLIPLFPILNLDLRAASYDELVTEAEKHLSKDMNARELVAKMIHEAMTVAPGFKLNKSEIKEVFNMDAEIEFDGSEGWTGLRDDRFGYVPLLFCSPPMMYP